MNNDAVWVFVVAINAAFALVAIVLVAAGLRAAHNVQQRRTRGSVRVAAGLGVLLLVAGLGAAAMALTLSGEDEPGWLVATWGGATIVLLAVAVRDFVAAAAG